MESLFSELSLTLTDLRLRESTSLLQENPTEQSLRGLGQQLAVTEALYITVRLIQILREGNPADHPLWEEEVVHL
jgi:hypothetical protein